MKVIHLSKWDVLGGAARAAFRIHQCLLRADFESFMRVRIKGSDDWRIQGPSTRLERLLNTVRSPLGSAIGKLQSHQPGGPRKGAWVPSSWSASLSTSNADVVNLHWVSDETISVRDIVKIRKPLVWCLHDMWPFCGMEHYAQEDADARWRHGYTATNRSRGASGLDLDRIMWTKKLRHFDRQLSIVAPSAWLADCATQSALLRNHPVTVIPHPLDLDVFKPLDRAFARAALNLPADRKIILFGAIGGGTDPRKGFDLLQDALFQLCRESGSGEYLCCVFGQSEPRSAPPLPFPIRWLGRIGDDTTLALIYSAVDVMVVPSRQEAFGQTGSEAAACGCPVLAFEDTGLADVVQHQETGYLARHGDVADLAHGLKWLLKDSERAASLSVKARARAESTWHFSAVSEKYRALYDEAIAAYARS